MTTATDDLATLTQLRSELQNFQEITKYLVPRSGDVPRLRGIEMFGGCMALTGTVGGDHLIYVDFKRRFDLAARARRAAETGRQDIVKNLERCEHMAGVALIDVAGHRATDAVLAAMLHQAFLTGALYELDMFGNITKRLFENLNSRFFQSSGAHKYVSLIYGEISEDATFRFLSAGQPTPVVFSRAMDRLMDVDKERSISFPPLGMMPSLDAIDRSVTHEPPLGFKQTYQLNEWQLMGAGDILLIHTDGLSDHRRGDEAYFPEHLEQAMRRAKDLSARGIYDAIRQDVLAFAPPADDVSLVAIKLG
ncbi:MAG: PP2C family protein-serine/threonine phosphatase [Vicinamibacterales bacterium]